ncbi:histidine kinase dimerization/phospho-acceptor domain-containing protein [Aliamphritea spongicola]|nr:histidine kinase dimerization/phospho-acceptor domain-containing protein [Aliamphritea spongicola]
MQFEMLREADQTRRELISNVSHDLRTPLSTIQGYLETLLIKNSSLNETERMEFLRTAMHSSHRLGQLIQDLFELSKLEAKQMSASCERFHWQNWSSTPFRNSAYRQRPKIFTLKWSTCRTMPLYMRISA